MRWLDAIDDFVRQYGRATPRWALFLTYEVDLDRLARSVLPMLARRGRRFRAVVLADQGALEQRLLLARTHLPGAVNLHPVRCKGGGIFHPKLLLLRAGHHVRACFGSANITDGGLGSNLELWTYSEAPDILAGVQHFVGEITRSTTLSLDDAARRSVRRALSGLVIKESPAVWSSLQESFASRLRTGPEARASRATIISPMYASAGGIKAARAAIPVSRAQLYTCLPAAAPRTDVFVYQPPDIADQTEDDEDAFPRTLHAKAYVFRGRRADPVHAWLGSANFTAQALTKHVAKGGNVELLVRTTLPIDEADALDRDLAALFRSAAGAGKVAAVEAAPPKPVATILGCELVMASTGPRLVVHSLVADGHVVLVNGKQQCRVTIKRGRGFVEGAALRKLLPDLDVSAPRTLVLHQLVRGALVPIVVNVPHVPPDNEPGHTSHASLDALLDDWLGRVPVRGGPEATDDTAGDDGDEDSADDDADDGDNAELERRLDEVRHQGELDQLAVKAALLKRLVVRSTRKGPGRDSTLADVLGALIVASPRHLTPSLRRLFDDVEPPEAP